MPLLQKVEMAMMYFKEVYEAGKVTDLGFADWENLRDYVQKLKTVDPQIEGRIVDVNQQ